MQPDSRANREYWDELAEVYQAETVIALDDIHYGPLIPGERALGLLPGDWHGRRCLELGCGAGQNSIALARRGAHCTAIDVAAQQLRRGQALAQQAGVAVDFVCGDLNALPLLPGARFDLVHSAFGLPFVAAPGEIVRRAADALLPGGRLVFSMLHPLFAAEWLEIEGEGCGAFVTDYFAPRRDERAARSGALVTSFAYPVSGPVQWVLQAGLELTGLHEPPPAGDPGAAPYRSDRWDALRDRAGHVPVCVICTARRP